MSEINMNTKEFINVDNITQNAIDKYNKRYKKDYGAIEYFTCDCYDRDDLIIGHVWKDTYKINETDSKSFYDLTLTFKTTTRDTDSVWTHNVGNNIFKRLNEWFYRLRLRSFWRIKTSLKILFKGYIEHEGTWIPARTFHINDNNKNASDNIFGYDTTLQFSDWLKLQAEFIRKEYNNQQ